MWPYGRRSAAGLASIYGLRMAAVFTLLDDHLAARLRLVPRWLAVLGYATAGRACWSVAASAVAEPGASPGWVFVLSVHILVVSSLDTDATGPLDEDAV